jgi:hypothetical protein
MQGFGRWLLVTVLLGLVAFFLAYVYGIENATSQPTEAIAFPEEAPAVTAYWQRRGCGHRHRFLTAHGRIRKAMRNHRAQVPKRFVRHLATCVDSREQSRQLHRFVKRSWRWRKQYEHEWPIKFHRLPEWAQAWAWSTSYCETGGTLNPATATGNGFYGAFQFVLSTWWAAGGTGYPHHHSWHYQAVIAVRWLYREGDEQWPVCGD